jgi:hypothetical protein
MRLRVVGAGAVVLAAAVACSTGGDDDQAAPPATSAAPTSTGAATATPTPSATPDLPPGCEGLLPFTDLDRALGRPLFGESRSVEGVAQASIGRTGRLTCYYGLAKGGRGTAPVEVGLSTYTDAAAAAKRVTATVAALRSGATSQTSATVAGQPTTVVGTRTAFTAVLSQGDRTIVVTVQRSVRGNPDKAAVRIAETAVANWGQ